MKTEDFPEFGFPAKATRSNRAGSIASGEGETEERLGVGFMLLKLSFVQGLLSPGLGLPLHGQGWLWYGDSCTGKDARGTR